MRDESINRILRPPAHSRSRYCSQSCLVHRPRSIFRKSQKGK